MAISFVRINFVHLFLTRDGGHSWEAKHSFPYARESVFFFLDTLRGWVISSIGGFRRPSLHITTDCALHWTVVPLPACGRAAQLHFVDEKNGFLLMKNIPHRKAGENSALFLTSDGGFTWNSLLEISEARMRTFCVPDADTIWMVGANGNCFRMTIASGRYEKIKTNTQMTIYDLSFCGPVGVAVGTSDVPTSPRGVLFLATADGGLNWSRLKSPVGAPFFAVHLTTWQSGVLAASTGLYSFRLS